MMYTDNDWFNFRIISVYVTDCFIMLGIVIYSAHHIVINIYLFVVIFL